MKLNKVEYNPGQADSMLSRVQRLCDSNPKALELHSDETVFATIVTPNELTTIGTTASAYEAFKQAKNAWLEGEH